MRKELLPITSPCMESWDAMDGDERERFCQKCSREVIDLSTRTRREVERLMRGHGEQAPCIRYAYDDDGNVELRPDPVMPLVPASVLLRGRNLMLRASLAISALAGCNPAGPAGDALVAREVIRGAAEKLAESGTCALSMEPVLPMELRLHSGSCATSSAVPAAPAEPPPVKPAAPDPQPAAPASDEGEQSVTVSEPPDSAQPGPKPKTPPHHPKKEVKPPKFPHRTMGKMVMRHDASLDD